MKITICCKNFGPRGGAEAFLRHFARHLLRRGHTVKVLAHRATDSIEGVELVRLHVPRVPRAFREWALARASARALAREDSDVTFSDQRCWGAQVVRPGGGVQRVYVRQRARSYRSAFARTAHGIRWSLSIRERLRLRIEDRLFGPPGPRLVIANSDMVRRELEEHFPHLRGRIRVVYNGVDVERFSPELRERHRERVRAELNVPPEALLAIFVGHDWRRKGLYPFIEALGLLKGGMESRAVYGLVVGRGNRRFARVFARRHGVEGRLRFTGPSEPDRYYGASDLLVLPSYYDACPNVTIEALACGLPVVTSVHTGSHALLTPGVDGLTVEDPSDTVSLARAIEHFGDPARLAAATEAARRKALRFPIEGQMDRIIEAIQSIAGR